jgi:dTDP-4-dehydrorhamnose reductase
MSNFSFELLDKGKTIVVFGPDGQLGKALRVCLKDLKAPVFFLGRSDCDLSNKLAIRDVLDRYRPAVIINAAAYTAVDKAESNRELAFAINAKAPAEMAHYIANIPDGILVHYSTDYVFGDSKENAYLETDQVGPVEDLNVYGHSKLSGEQAIEQVFNLAYNSSHKSLVGKFSRYFIFRTSWVYGDGSNFIRTILRLAVESDKLKVVADQVGAPTSARWLAEVSLQIAGSRVKSGIYHAVPDGDTSWYGLAVFAIQSAVSCGVQIKVKSENILPIFAIDYPLSAKRPYNSRLNNAKLKQALSELTSVGHYPHWLNQVEVYVKDCFKQSLI